MGYRVIEIQKGFDGSVAQLDHPAETEMEMLATFHTVMAAAALSNLACHSAVVLTDEGSYVDGGAIRHEPPAPEPSGDEEPEE